MDLKVKYQYTYFIKPFLINENKYEKYLLSLLNNKNFKLKLFEKERDLNLYSYFIKNIRDYFFPTFLFSKDKKNNLERLDNKTKALILSKLHCNIFEYNFNTKIQGKVSNEDGIFFNINKMEIICLDTGICFLVIKTNVDSSEKFSDLLNFNYRFKDINSDFTKLRDFTNIKIQTDKFNNMSELSDFINDVIGVNNNSIGLKDVDLYNKRFFVYTYSCIDQDNWSTGEDFENLQSDFLRYSNVISSDDTLDFNIDEFDKNIGIIEEFKNSIFGFTKQSASLMTSSIDINNYTKLLFGYENEYFYTLIISLYQRIYLKKLENEFKSKKDINNVRKKFTKFTKELWLKEITNSVTGTIFYNKWKEIFELQEIYDEIKNKYDVIYKELNIEKNYNTNKIILVALIVSLLLNVINFISLINIINK